MVTRTKRYTWSLNSPATPELIDDYFRDFSHNETDEFTNAARDAARTHCKRQADALRKYTTDGKDEYKIEHVASTAIPFVDGFLAGCRYTLEKVPEWLGRS